jgi:invasion protein IalB
MSVRSLFAVGVPAAILVAAGSGFLMIGEEGKSGWQMAQLTPPLVQSERLVVAAQAPQATPPAAAPGAAPQAPSRGPGWAVNCKSEATDKALDCRLSQTVVTENRQLLANVTFHFPPAPQKPETIVQVPLGVLLPAGATVQVDENTAQQLSFRACDRNGCYAQGPLSPDVLAQLRKGKQVSVAFKNLAEKEIKVPLSLDGFGPAYGKVPSS